MNGNIVLFEFEVDGPTDKAIDAIANTRPGTKLVVVSRESMARGGRFFGWKLTSRVVVRLEVQPEPTPAASLSPREEAMTTSTPTIPANAIVMANCGNRDFLSHNQAGLLPYAIDHSWERAFSRRMDPNIASLDETIAAGYGVCFNRVRGVYAKDHQPMTVRAPGTGQQFGSEPRGLDQWQSNDDQVPAIRKRTDACRAKGLPAIAYVGGLPLDCFAWLELGQRNSRIGAMVRWVSDCGFTTVALDLTALDSQEKYRSSTMMLVDELRLGFGVCIEAQPRLHPGILPWLEGRFGCIHGPDKLGQPEYMTPKSAGACFNANYLWLQGSLSPDQRLKLAATNQDMVPIIDIQGLRVKGVA